MKKILFLMLLFLVSCKDLEAIKEEARSEVTIKYQEDQKSKVKCKYFGRGIYYCEIPNGDVCYTYYSHGISCKFNNQDYVK